MNGKHVFYVLLALFVAISTVDLHAKKKVKKTPVTSCGDYSVDSVNLMGELKKDNMKFYLIFVVDAKTPSRFEIVGGDVCELNSDVKEKDRTFFWGGEDAEVVYENGGYYLVCPEKGKYEVVFQFGVKVTTKDNMKSCQFRLLPAISRRVSIESDFKDVEFVIKGALNLTKSGPLVKKESRSRDGQKAASPRMTENVGRTNKIEKEDEKIVSSPKLVVSATLEPEGEFQASWKRHVEKIESELVTSVKPRLIYEVLPGTVKLSGMIYYSIIQGELTEMRIGISPDLNILNIIGNNIQDWRIVEDSPTPVDEKKTGFAGKRKTLVVRLGRPYEGDYMLGVEAEKILSDFPCEFTLPAICPKDVLRVDGMLAFGTNRAVKLILGDVTGMSQVDNRSFGMGKVLSATPPKRSLFTFHYFGDQYGLKVDADNIFPNYSIKYTYALNFKDEELSARALCELDIKDAPLRELLVRYAAGLVVNRVEGACVVPDDYELFERDGAKWLKVPFKEDTIGKTSFTVYFERNMKSVNEVELPAFYVDKTKNVRGFLLLAASKGLTLEPNDLIGLRQVHTGSAPIREPGLQFAYRFKDQNWAGKVTIKREKASITSEVFHLASVGEGTIYGSSVFTWHVTGAPVDKILFAVSPELKNLEFTGRDIVDWKKLEEKNGDRDVWVLNLREKISDDYQLLATYEIPLGDDREFVELGAIATKSAEAENGFIALTSQRNLRVSDVKLPESAHPVELYEMAREYRDLIENPVLKIWRCDQRGTSVNVMISAYASEDLLDVIVDHTEYRTSVDSNGEAVTTAQYRIKNSNRQFLSLRLPEGAKLWSVTVDKQHRRLSLDKGRLLIPLPRFKDINIPIPVTVTYAEKHDKPKNGSELKLNAPILEVESMFCRWTVGVPSNFNITNVDTSMRSSFHPPLSGMGGLLTRLSKILERWMFRGVMVPWFLLTIGGIIYAWSWGKNRFRFFATTICVLLVILSLMTLTAVVGRGGLLPPSEPFSSNTIEFSHLFSLPGDALHLDLKLDDMSAVTGAGIGRFAIFAILAGGAFVATFYVRKRFQKAILLAIGVVLILGGGVQWLKFSALAALALSVLIPCAFSVGLGVMIYRACRKNASVVVLITCLFATMGMSAETPSISISDVRFNVKVGEKSLKIDGFYDVKAKNSGEMLLLAPPAVITGVLPDSDDVEIIRRGNSYFMKAKRAGDHRFTLSFLVPFQRKNGVTEFQVPVPLCLKNSVEVSTDMKNMRILSPNAVVFQSDENREPAMAQTSFVPGAMAFFKICPRARNVEEEKIRFFASVDSMVVFAAGYAQLTHKIDFRIAQGETTKFVVDIPKNMSVTAVDAPDLGAWQYDRADNLLEILFSQPKHGDLSVVVTTQIANLSLPYEVELSTLKIRNVARQHGAFGLMADPSVQIQVENNKGFNRINNSDFSVLRRDVDNAVLKQAFRYHQTPAELNVKAVPVEPEIRVNEQCRIDLAEERSTISSTINVEVAKAGVFSIVLDLPEGFEIDKLTGEEIQHWDEIDAKKRRQAKIHFSRKIIGSTSFFVELSRMGSIAGKDVVIPRLKIVDALRQTGELSISVEKGTRLSLIAKRGVEKQSGSGGKSLHDTIYKFNILRPDWQLRMAFDVADPWVQVDNLQIARMRNGFVVCEAIFRYAIENAGVKRFRLKMPPGADTPEIVGADIVSVTNPEADIWEVELHRKTTGDYRLSARYRMNMVGEGDVSLSPVKALDVDLVKGYVAVFAEDSLVVKAKDIVGEVSTYDARKIPALFHAGNLSNAVLCYRVIGADYVLNIELIKHKIAKTLKAEIDKVELTSIVSSEERSITRAVVSLNNLADENFLRVRLPDGCVVWSVFVDKMPVDAARTSGVAKTKQSETEKGELLIPLRQSKYGSVKQTVEFVYSTRPEERSNDKRELYNGPSFSLPLRDVIWNLYLPPDKNYASQEGTLDYVDDSMTSIWARSVSDYDRFNQEIVDKNISQAKLLFKRGNSLAKQGDEMMAQKLYLQASNLSENDSALNNDIQGQQMKIQREQAVVSLAARRGAAKSRLARPNVAVDVQQDAPTRQTANQRFESIRQRLGGAEEKTLRLISDKIYQQQKAAMSVPQPLAVTLPEEGRKLKFERKLQITENAPLEVGFKATKKAGVLQWLSTPVAYGILIIVLSVIFWMLTGFQVRLKE